MIEINRRKYEVQYVYLNGLNGDYTGDTFLLTYTVKRKIRHIKNISKKFIDKTIRILN